MATRKMDALYPKRKSAPAGGKGNKMSAISKKAKDSLAATYEDLGMGTGTLGSSAAQPAALISSGRKDLNEDYDDVEEILRQFDMNMAYGPCLGLSRVERWERAHRIGLDPPQNVKNMLQLAGGNPDCLWEGRV